MPVVTAPATSLVRLSDITAAALLVANGFTLLRVEPTSDPRRREFVLEGNRDEARALLDTFTAGAATVQLDTFVAAQRKLKNILHRGDLFTVSDSP